MIAEDSNQHTPMQPPQRQSFSLLRVLVGLLIAGLTIWFVAKEVVWADVREAFVSAETLPILLAAAVVVFTAAVKSYRWSRLFQPPGNIPTVRNSFWAFMLNQFVNNVVPGRFGEIARAYSIHQSDQAGRSRALGTLVLEKSVDLLFTALTVLVILPWAVLPEGISNPTQTLVITSVTVLVILYLFAYQTDFVTNIIRKITRIFPAALGNKLLGISTAGLEGLAALRSRTAALEQLALSAFIAFLHVVPAYLLFKAFDLPFGIIEATVINLGVLIMSVPPSTPGKIGVVEFVIVTLLGRFDPSLSDATMLSYAIVFHMIVLLPFIALGAIAALRSDWGWRTSDSHT